MLQWRVKDYFLGPIIAGQATLFIRPGFEQTKQAQVGDEIHLYSTQRWQRVIVRAIRQYENFEEMLANEKCQQIHPTADRGWLLQTLRRLYRRRTEGQGVYVFEIRAVDDRR